MTPAAPRSPRVPRTTLRPDERSHLHRTTRTPGREPWREPGRARPQSGRQHRTGRP
ncbi:hypothetical protein SGL43_00619 [Streptomyces globisporus]|uniref:Uncharacterized protein n=1 Tax=Streptomyces globisporus TaxID=1908 RepID=A0ABM9GQF9_STRGL|nr:hypothetical protein SGL43_00619 [Streptomyces globisporus]